MIKVLKISVLLLVSSLLYTCSDSQDKTKVLNNNSALAISTPIVRLDTLLLACHSKDDIKDFIHQNRSVISTYFPEQQFGNQLAISTMLLDLTNNTALQNFHQQIDSLYDFGALEQQLGQAFGRIKSQYPSFKPPRVCTMFTGFTSSDLYVSDSLIVIGLDFFGGPKAKFRPQIYQYQLHRYAPEYLLPQIMTLLSAKYNTSNLEDQSLLADMIFYGKSYEFVHQMLPNTPDSLIIGYSGVELNETETAQDLIWGHFIDEQLLYKTDEFSKKKYIGDAPKTPAIGPRCPGSIGRWLGWKIVRKYLENQPNMALNTLMNNAKAQQILEGSKYRGQ